MARSPKLRKPPRPIVRPRPSSPEENKGWIRKSVPTYGGGKTQRQSIPGVRLGTGVTSVSDPYKYDPEGRLAISKSRPREYH